MKNLILLIVLTFGSSMCISAQNTIYQPYIPFTFKNHSPIWSHYSKVTSFLDTIQTYQQQQVELSADNKALYTLHNISDRYFIQGFLLEKIDMITGNTLWQNHSFSTKKGERMFGNQFIQQNETIKLSLNKENQPAGPIGNPVWIKSLLRTFTFDNSDGTKKDSLIVNPTDKAAVSLLMPFAVPFNQASNAYFWNNVDGTCDYIFQQGHTKGINLIKSVLNQFGNKIDSVQCSITTTKLPKSGQLFKKADGSYQFFFNAQGIDSTQKEDVRVFYLDKDLNIVRTIDLSNQMEENIYAVLYTDEDYFILCAYKNFIQNNVNMKKVIYTLFKKDGTKVETVTDEYESNKSKGFRITKLPDNKLLLIKGVEDNGESSLVFLQSDGKNQLQLRKNIVLADTSIALLTIRSISLTKENDILLSVLYAHKANLTAQYCPKWSNFILFSSKALGLTTASKETVEQATDVRLMPNPATTYLNIVSDASFDCVKIYNITGQLQSVLFTADNIIPIENLNAGLYFIECYQHNKKIGTAKKFIKL